MSTPTEKADEFILIIEKRAGRPVSDDGKEFLRTHFLLVCQMFAAFPGYSPSPNVGAVTPLGRNFLESLHCVADMALLWDRSLPNGSFLPLGAVEFGARSSSGDCWLCP